MTSTMSVRAPVRTTPVPSVDEAFDVCAKIANAHYENFPIASIFLPAAKRPYIQAIYAFSRIADDFADEGDRFPAERMRDLDDWDEQLHACYQGHASHPVFVALGETVRRLDIPIEPLADLLKAFRQDVATQRYETFTDLLDYCRCSANPIGRLVLMIFGYRHETLFRLSDDICTALQLTNFWQDIDIDRRKNRCYLPLEDIRRFNYSLDRWEDAVVDDEFRALVKFQVERTRRLFYGGATLPDHVERDLRLELKLVWFGGMRILSKIERAKHDVVHRRPSLGGFDKFAILLCGLFVNDLARFGKKREGWDLR